MRRPEIRRGRRPSESFGELVDRVNDQVSHYTVQHAMTAARIHWQGKIQTTGVALVECAITPTECHQNTSQAFLGFERRHDPDLIGPLVVLNRSVPSSVPFR